MRDYVLEHSLFFYRNSWRVRGTVQADDTLSQTKIIRWMIFAAAPYYRRIQRGADYLGKQVVVLAMDGRMSP